MPRPNKREDGPVRAALPRPVPPAEQPKPRVVEPVPPGRPKLTLRVE